MQSDPNDTLEVLATEGYNPSTAAIDCASPLDIARIMNAEDARVAEAVRAELPAIARAIEGIAGRLRGRGRLIYVGAGTSGRLGVLDASECPPTFSTPPEMVLGIIAGGREALIRSVEEAEDSTDAGREDLRKARLTERDAVVGIAASGRTPYVLGALSYAREQEALTVGLACNRRTPMEKLVDIMIAPVVGAEVISGSTRLKSGTAQKMMLNMLSTGSMVLLGKTYGNLMVDVQPTNSKLRQRAVRIVQRATRLGESEAAKLLQRTGGAKVAIVAAHTGLSPEAARVRLAEHGGRVRSALGEDS